MSVAVDRGRMPISGAATSSCSGTAFSVVKDKSVERGENNVMGVVCMRA